MSRTFLISPQIPLRFYETHLNDRLIKKFRVKTMELGKLIKKLDHSKFLLFFLLTSKRQRRYQSKFLPVDRHRFKQQPTSVKLRKKQFIFFFHKSLQRYTRSNFDLFSSFFC